MLVVRFLTTFLFVVAVSGCSSLIENVTSDFADGLTRAMLNQNDPQIVKDGAPAYLIMLDGFIENDPESSNMLMAAAELYGAYASGFVTEKERIKKLTARAFDYAQRGACLEEQALCNAKEQTFDQINAYLSTVDDADDLKPIYSLASAWAGFIRANTDDWNAVANVAKVQRMMETVVAVDSDYQNGQAHLYLGVLKAQIPPSLGGKPAQALAHFEQAWAISGEENLMALVFEAEFYARLLFEEELHNQLLNKAIQSDVQTKAFTLSNELAKQRAQALLISGKDYF